jgi:heptosyltransferase I
LRILIVKTSSLGDVVHALPVVHDIMQNQPDAQVDWVAEEAFTDIPRLHPHVQRVIPVALRRWRKSWWKADTRREWRAFKTTLQARAYDRVIDLQGLLKSAWLTRAVRLSAHGAVHGYAGKSVREPLAMVFYSHHHTVDKAQHAVARNRALAAAALGYRVSGDAQYGLSDADTNAVTGTTALWFTATSNLAKAWPDAEWVALGQQLRDQFGLTCQLVAGSPAERRAAQALAAQVPGATVLPPLRVGEIATVLRTAQCAIGVDTGLTHWAAALGVPTVGIYTATDPARTGVHAACARNVGGAAQTPSAANVLAALQSIRLSTHMTT